jgi:inorganic triphosphatase YgiF
MTPEVELKLQVPAHQRAALRARVLRGRCTSQRLRALYFDTPNGALAAAGIVLRLRREGRRWVQAIKCAGDGPLSRLEHECVLGVGRDVPALDLSRHAASSGYKPLLAALSAHVDALAPVFEVRVRRHSRLVRHEGASIELALDEGHIVGGRARLAVSELELELKSGAVTALASLARRWVQRHGLWLDVRSKAERGLLLVRQQAAMPAARAGAPALAADASPDAALRAITRAALSQILPHAAALAAEAGDAEHVHQARIGLRRLLSVWREFGHWSADVQPRWTSSAAALFKSLGQARDRDALSQWVLPQLQAAAAPSCEIDAQPDAVPSMQVFRSAEATLLLLDLLAFAHADAAPAAVQASASASTVSMLAGPRLLRLHRQLRRAGEAFTSLDDVQRHRARKRLKRLRYCAESVSALWPAHAWQAYARRLQRAQEQLGLIQDVAVAKAAFSARRDRDPRAWFALGWLAAQEPRMIKQAGRALQDLGKAPKFLR